MKHLLLNLCLCLFGLYAFADTNLFDNTNERWDSKSYSYRNFKYGFSWKLPTYFDWKMEYGEERHTVFRATCGPILVFVNAQEQKKMVNLWEVLPRMRKITEIAEDEMESQTGKRVFERTWEKKTLFGRQAIKTTFKEYFKDDRFDDAIEAYVEEYYLLYNGYSYIIAIKMSKGLCDIIDTAETTFIFSDIIKGFGLTSGI